MLRGIIPFYGRKIQLSELLLMSVYPVNVYVAIESGLLTVALPSKDDDFP